MKRFQGFGFHLVPHLRQRIHEDVYGLFVQPTKPISGIQQHLSCCLSDYMGGVLSIRGDLGKVAHWYSLHEQNSRSLPQRCQGNNVYKSLFLRHNQCYQSNQSHQYTERDHNARPPYHYMFPIHTQYITLSGSNAVDVLTCNEARSNQTTKPPCQGGDVKWYSEFNLSIGK